MESVGSEIFTKGRASGFSGEQIVSPIIIFSIPLNATILPTPASLTRGGYASKEAGAREGDMKPLFEAIIQHIPAPKGDPDAPLQALISTIDYSEYVGRIGQS